jgi:AcrR family transcriptional regulator
MDQIHPAPKRENTHDRRFAIAMAARALIVEKGFEGLRMRDIADRVGINIATLHYHVPSKEALIELVAQTIKGQFAAQDQSRPRAHLPPLTRLHMELEDFREILSDEPDLAIVFCELLDRARRDRSVCDVITPLRTFWTGQFEALLADGVADGSLRPDLDPFAGALLISGALGAFWRRSPVDLSAYDRLVRELERAIINPLKAFSNKDISK